MSINIGETPAGIKASVNVLTNLQSDEFVMLAKILNFHWCVTGPSFGPDHAFFETLYRTTFESIDAIAERIRSLDMRPVGTIKGMLSNTRIKEYCDNEPIPNSAGMYRILLQDYETIVREVRTDLKNLESIDPLDEGTVAFLQDYIQNLEKKSWMIRSHLS